jgi:hypothetical protein
VLEGVGVDVTVGVDVEVGVALGLTRGVLVGGRRSTTTTAGVGVNGTAVTVGVGGGTVAVCVGAAVLAGASGPGGFSSESVAHVALTNSKPRRTSSP